MCTNWVSFRVRLVRPENRAADTTVSKTGESHATVSYYAKGFNLATCLLGGVDVCSIHRMPQLELS